MPRCREVAAGRFDEELVIKVADAAAAQCLMGNLGSRRVEDPIPKSIVGLPEKKITAKFFFWHGDRPGHRPRLLDDLIDVACQMVKTILREESGGNNDAPLMKAFPLGLGQVSFGLFHRRIVGRVG